MYHFCSLVIFLNSLYWAKLPVWIAIIRNSNADKMNVIGIASNRNINIMTTKKLKAKA